MDRKRLRLFSGGLRLLMAVSGLGIATTAGFGKAAGPAEYGVRSMVAKSSGGPTDGRVYAVLSVQMASSNPQNTPLVDEDSLVIEVCKTLNAHGFRQVTKGRNPEILITIHYGRAWLRNPYLYETGDSQAIEGFSSVPALVNKSPKDVTGVPTHFMDEMSRAREAKIQKAAAEKLYVRITGWQNPSDPKARAVMLWKTTTLVDDPDSWNLNAIAGGMLEAGAPYFDRAITEKEIDVHPPPPEGQVNVGSLEVVDSAPVMPSLPVVPPPAGRLAPTRAGKTFDLPAGDALATLQAFSRQSGEEIIYPIEQVRGVRTNAVHGDMSPRAALDRLLDGTGLSAVQDEKTEALAVRLSPRR